MAASNGAGEAGDGKTRPVDKLKKILPVICATRDFQGAVAYSIATIWNAAFELSFEPIYVQFMAHGYAFVRASVFAGLKKDFNTDLLRGIMIDDDILLRDQKRLMVAISIADQYGWNFVAPYRVRDGYVSLAHEDGSLMSRDEALTLKDWDRVANAGLGFYYGDLPLTYRFHEDGAFGGEDLNFFWDNPGLDLRQVDLGLRHLKVMDLGMDTPIAYQKRPESKPKEPERPLPPTNEDGTKVRIAAD